MYLTKPIPYMGRTFNLVSPKCDTYPCQQVSRGRRNMGVKCQKPVEAALEAPAKVAPAQRPSVDQRALWNRMDAHGIRCAMSLGSLILA